jgi:hypothetical protein
VKKNKTTIEYRFEYKCRRCGCIDDSAATTNECLAHLELINSYLHLPKELYDPKGHSVGMYSTHLCKDGGIGISDLQGYSSNKI